MQQVKKRPLGKTGLMVSEIGFGGEWMERHSDEECRAVIDRCTEAGINILDCWMSNPDVRTRLGKALRGRRDKWMIQGQIGSTWQNGEHIVTRDVAACRVAFEDLLTRMETDYMDIGMIHFVDSEAEWDEILHSPFLDYIMELKAAGTVHHIGLGTHNPRMVRRAVESGFVEVILFSVNPAFDMMPPSEDIETYFAESYDAALAGIDPERAAVYDLCEKAGVGITVMKGYAGGRLFDEKRSPFGVALTPVQCLHYALSRPAVASVLVGYDTPEQVEEAIAYETATDAEKDYASVLAGAPMHAYYGQCTYCGHCQPCPVNIDIAMVNKYYDLATLQPEVPASIRQHYAALAVPASACLGCGACETRCPFGVKIAERMVKAAALFE